MKFNYLLISLLVFTIISINPCYSQNNNLELEEYINTSTQDSILKFINYTKIPKGKTVKTLKFIDSNNIEYTKKSPSNSVILTINIEKGIIEYSFFSNKNLTNIGEYYFPVNNIKQFEKFDDFIFDDSSLAAEKSGSCGGLAGLIDQLMDAIEEAIASGQSASSSTVVSLIYSLASIVDDYIRCLVK